MSDSQSHGSIIALAVVFTSLALFFVGLRIWSRLVKGSRFAADDYTIFISAILFFGIIFIPMTILAVDTGLGDHSKLGPQGSPLPPPYLFNITLRLFQCLHVFPIMFAKLSILFFYRRIFRGRTFSITTWTIIALAIMWGISFFISILFDCTPISLSLSLPLGSLDVHCIDQIANFWALSLSDVIINIIIMIIPFPFVWDLQMSTKHKACVSGIFLLGTLAILASVARLVCFMETGSLLAEESPDATWYVAPTVYWVLIECSLAIVSACLPTLGPLFHGLSLQSMLRSIRSALPSRNVPTEIIRPKGLHASTFDTEKCVSALESASHFGINAWRITVSQEIEQEIAQTIAVSCERAASTEVVATHTPATNNPYAYDMNNVILPMRPSAWEAPWLRRNQVVLFGQPF